MSIQLTKEDVARVGLLGRLALSDSEMEGLVGQLNGLMAHFERLQDVNTEGIEPTSHPVAMRNVLRDDVALPSLPRDVATSNAPETRDGNFIVPQIVDG
jgi:aspartyl-tRNA(Asn)/glutamyl-tRNA(Gln) amidotransferase subunit C